MKYNFNTITDRSNNFAAKYDELGVKFGREDIIPMWIADMDFKTAEPIIDAMRERLDQGIFGYVSRPDSYFESVSQWYKKRHDWDVSSDCMSHSHGVIPGMVMMMQEFTEPGDKIIIQSPVYNEFFEIVEDHKRELLVSSLKVVNGRYEMDYEDFENKVKSGVKMFFLCNPHNPVGTVWTKEELKKIGDICIKYGVQVVSDEIHCELVYKNNKYTPFASISKEFFENSITCVAPSKTFNLAGLQTSIIIFGNKKQKDTYDHLLQINDIKRNNCFSLVATEAAYRHGEEWLEQLLEYLHENLQFVNNYIESNIPKLKTYVPEGTYFSWIDCRELGMTAEELKEFTINEVKVGFGLWYGKESEGFIRMNVACPRSVIEEALNRLKTAIDKL
ncbi:pyridoxal phosphate-dependent aminotransferase [Clostridium senegalense]|uniref:MalY/PatB family protein n=1 Tax=Clostridium senegalense TaxID=1465809 RepID=UPI001C0FB1D8|nr:MalY/PatB family protein [Clostridium senegalense]MBU5226554.1 pyridoxal phosphate-dependent aminotransferase [Clostridium senegalense]